MCPTDRDLDLDRFGKSVVISDGEEEGDSIEVPADTWRTSSVDFSLCLVGRVLTHKTVHTDSLTRALTKAMLPIKGMTINRVGEDRFLFIFNHEWDRERTIEGSPWTFDNHMIVLSPIPQDSDPATMPLNHCDFFVHIHGLPLSKHTRAMACFIGDKIGIFRDVDFEQQSKGRLDSMRVRIGVLMTEPLKKSLKLRSPNGDDIVVYFTYEKLGTFCYICGLCDHTEQICEARFNRKVVGKEKNFPYGDWIRESTRTSMAAEKRSLGPLHQPPQQSSARKPIFSPVRRINFSNERILSSSPPQDQPLRPPPGFPARATTPTSPHQWRTPLTQNLGSLLHVTNPILTNTHNPVGLNIQSTNPNTHPHLYEVSPQPLSTGPTSPNPPSVGLDQQYIPGVGLSNSPAQLHSFSSLPAYTPALLTHICSNPQQNNPQEFIIPYIPQYVAGPILSQSLGSNKTPSTVNKPSPEEDIPRQKRNRSPSNDDFSPVSVTRVPAQQQDFEIKSGGSSSTLQIIATPEDLRQSKRSHVAPSTPVKKVSSLTRLELSNVPLTFSMSQPTPASTALIRKPRKFRGKNQTKKSSTNDDQVNAIVGTEKEQIRDGTNLVEEEINKNCTVEAVIQPHQEP